MAQIPVLHTVPVKGGGTRKQALPVGRGALGGAQVDNERPALTVGSRRTRFEPWGPRRNRGGRPKKGKRKGRGPRPSFGPPTPKGGIGGSIEMKGTPYVGLVGA